MKKVKLEIVQGRVQTVGELIHKESDGDLLNMYEEIQESKLPADGYIKAFCRRCNKLIDKGELCVNRLTYRKVYAPTVVKLVESELAYRYSIHFALTLQYREEQDDCKTEY